MINSKINSYSSNSTTLQQKVANIIISALLFGFGWHIRGSGASDATVPILLFLLFIGFLFSPREKFNAITFGLIVIVFRVLRRGWGTFVGMVTGKLEGYDYLIGKPEISENYIFYSVNVPWWHGYMFLFIVGLAWAGLAALILGGYFFSDKEYYLKDMIISLILYLVGFGIGLVIATNLIPIIASDEYYVYTELQMARNYVSMRDNIAFAFAVVPVFIYILFVKKDVYFVKISALIMIIFGIGLSTADIWQWYGRIYNPELPFWSLWEYFSGFIIGGLIMTLFYIIPEQRWKESDLEFNFYPADTKLKKFVLYLFGHLFLYLYAISESVNGALNSSLRALGYDIDFSTVYMVLIVLAIDIPLYLLYMKETFGTKFRNKEFSEKCLIILILFVPFAYFCYVIQFMVSFTYLKIEIRYLVTWMDTISVVIVEIYLIFLYIKREK